MLFRVIKVAYWNCTCTIYGLIELNYIATKSWIFLIMGVIYKLRDILSMMFS